MRFVFSAEAIAETEMVEDWRLRTVYLRLGDTEDGV